MKTNTNLDTNTDIDTTIHCNSSHLRNYKNEVWNLTKKNLAFNINFVPGAQNSIADFVAKETSILSPLENIYVNKSSVELLFRPSIQDNITNLHVFSDDDQIKEFLTYEDTFKGSIIDDEAHF